MAAFSYQEHHTFLDSAYLPNIPIEMSFVPQVGDMSNVLSCFHYYYPSDTIPEISATDARTYESSSSLDRGIKVSIGESQMDYSSVVVEPLVSEGVSKPQSSMEKKRKSMNGTCLSSGQSKDTKVSKSRKQKKLTGGMRETEEKKPLADDAKEIMTCEEPPKGYIHVRARRGQATDSHSLAERVRREKISERMKMLQGLVPGCDKITGKALMLDEIINYVQSLQNQVEFLSMRLASVNPILYDFGMDFDDLMNHPEKLGSMSQPLPSVQQTSHIQPTAFEDTTNNYPLMDNSAPFLLQGQGPTAFSQDNGSFLMQVGEQRQGFHSGVGFNNM